jgi:hypothetical protein
MRKRPIRKSDSVVPKVGAIGSGFNLIDPSLQLLDTPELHAAVRDICAFLDDVLVDTELELSVRKSLDRAPIGGKSTGVSNEILAMSLSIKHPDWSVKQIAEELGVSRTSIYRWPSFRLIRELQKGIARQEMQERVPKGFRGGRADGMSFEAFDDAEEIL